MADIPADCWLTVGTNFRTPCGNPFCRNPETELGHNRVLKRALLTGTGRMTSPTVADFIEHTNWFRRKYAARSDGRYPTFQAALNLFLQRGGCTIVETGCVRQVDDFGAGCSTILFSEMAARYDGFLWSVDHTPEFVRLSQDLTSFASEHRSIVLSDSIAFLERGLLAQPGFTGSIDLLYLDSFDYPWAELLEWAQTQTDADPAQYLAGLPEAQLLARHSELLLAPQTHCLRELQAAWPLLHAESVVLFDDNDFPGGGKPRMAKQWLREHGWQCVLDLQQSLWISC